MTTTAKVLLAFLTIALITHVWMYRLDLRVGGSLATPIVLDRWTGQVSICPSANNCYSAYPPELPLTREQRLNRELDRRTAE